jgi:hypothetical protein
VPVSGNHVSRPHVITALLFGAIALACAEPTLPPGGNAFSLVHPGGGIPPDQVGIALPDTVSGGAAITVPFYTWGSSSCTVAAGEDLAIVGRTVTLTPYDRARSANAICTMDLHRFVRQTVVSVPTGEVTFQLRGRRLGSGPGDELIILSRTVTVRP